MVRVRRAGYGLNAPKRPLRFRTMRTIFGPYLNSWTLRLFHPVGHSSGGLIGLQLASDHPELVRSLILLEPAPCGPLQAPAFAEIGERFIGPAMGALAAGNMEGAFDTFMRGVCGDGYLRGDRAKHGKAGVREAVRESRFFFRDEVLPPCSGGSE